LGGKFLSVGSRFIQTSSDGINWTAADQVNYVPQFISRLYKFGSRYYAATGNGLYQSADGITFTLASRNIPPSTVSSIAYSGSVLLALVPSSFGQPQIIYKSTDGVTWAKSADIGTRTNTGNLPGTPIDIVYANGNFVLGQPNSSPQNLNYTIYTSADGVTWTGRATPYLSQPVNALASDNTTVVYGSNFGTFKSTDGGVTWSIINGTTVSTPAYSNGAWIFAGTGNFSTSSDLSTFNFTGIVAGSQEPRNFYVFGNNIVGLAQQSAAYFNKSAGGYTALPVKGYANIGFSFSTNKEMPIRGTTALVPATLSNATMANVLAEVPLYSYNTATTFWIPPSNAGAGQQAYIYAGA
jgi:hypothetical protein